MRPERQTIETARGAFSYLHWAGPGATAPALHFAHANGFNGQTYTTLLEPLAEHFRVYAWDARGHGQTPAPADPASVGRSWDGYVEDLAAFLAAFDGPWTLAGHSLGAVASMQATVRGLVQPQRLVLADPVFLPPLFLPAWGLAKRLGLGYRMPLAPRALRRRLVWPDRQSMEESYCCRGGFQTWTDRQMLTDYVEGGTRERPDGQVELTCAPAWEAATFAATPHTVWRELARLSVPLTVVYGGASDTFRPSAAHRLARIQPTARLVNVPGASHFVPMEHPEAIRNELM